MSAPTNVPYKIMSFKEFVPEKLRFILYVFFAVIFQFSGGIYLGLVNQMVGSLALIRQDVLMAGYSMFVGTTMIFPLLFPIKFRFTGKSQLIVSALVLIVCNVIAMQTDSLIILAVVSFIAGVFRMIGTFECFSTIQLKITPTRDFAYFFPVIYAIILASIQLSGIVAQYIAYFYTWQYMQVLIIGLLCVMLILEIILGSPFRPTPDPQSLKGTDWIGAIAWSAFLILMIFGFEYGEHYEWFESKYITFSFIMAFVLLGAIFFRNKQIERPYISWATFTQKKMFTMTFLFTALYVLLGTTTTLQNIFTGSILHYDELTTISLNWPILFGVVLGSIFSFVTLVRYQWGIKLLAGIGFVFMLAYQVLMYFLISPDTDVTMFYLPLIFRGAGHAIIYISLTVYAAKVIPFIYFFQALSVFGFIRTGFGSAMGNAIMERLYEVSMRQNADSLATNMDSVSLSAVSPDSLYAEFSRQLTLVSVKEVYGYAVMFGILILLIFLGTRYRTRLNFKMPWV